MRENSEKKIIMVIGGLISLWAIADLAIQYGERATFDMIIFVIGLVILYYADQRYKSN